MEEVGGGRWNQRNQTKVLNQKNKDLVEEVSWGKIWILKLKSSSSLLQANEEKHKNQSKETTHFSFNVHLLGCLYWTCGLNLKKKETKEQYLN